MNIPGPDYALCVVHAARVDIDGGAPFSRDPSASIESLVHQVRWPLSRAYVRAEEA